MTLAAVVAAAPTHITAHQPATPALALAATYDTGLGGSGAEIIDVRHTDGLAVLTNIAGSVDVLDLSDPASPQLLTRVMVDTTAGAPNSAAIHPQHDFFLVVSGRAGSTGTVAAYALPSGEPLGSAPVGIQPDSIAIAPNGQYAVVANEAEATGVGQNGGSGSMSIVDLSGFNGSGPGTFSVTTIPLPGTAGVPGMTVSRTDDIGRIAIDNSLATLEPESVAFSPDSRFAYVTLQENNAVIRFERHSGEMAIVGLGTVLHDADVVNGGGYVPTPGYDRLREPDGIALNRTGQFFVTADEGDTRNAAGSGGPRGGRTVSVFNAETGALIGDTGSQLDDAAAAAVPSLYPDGRSDRGGSEPECLDLTDHRGRTLVAVGLERANAVALIDVSDPSAPSVIDLAASDANPEGIKFLKRGGRLFVLAANEAAGTVWIFEVVD
jgi:DNA-binding beta-propeller fold protein YncE